MTEDNSSIGSEGPGSFLGPYRLLEVIGEGGFGSVFRAEQTQPVQREVALKILKLGMDTREVVARFEAERQALALMDHPAISKVYDAGATEAGRPYFVMELVEGEPLTDYCAKRGLSTSERLMLFGDVCRAVQHAHQKGVLHRDLKPSNVLVTEVDGAPLPKVIDFGIAKAIERPLTDSTLATEAFQIMGTPAYMPPEQAAGRDVDTRADVYALGVLLYEMLARTRPFVSGAPDSGRPGLEQLGELLRQIHEVTPPKPSTRVSQLAKSGSHDPSEVRTLTRALRGDLDWIAMKALEKDRERRYSSAAELADDVARHLANEPVLASPPSTVYRMRKFVRRNQLAVGSAVLIAVTLVVATAALGVLYTRSVVAEEKARQEAETSRRALDFMTGMFAVSDPSEARGRTVTAREILDRGAERIERELADQPGVRSTLMANMGSVYGGLGLYERAEDLVASAVATRADLLGEEHPDTLRANSLLADLRGRQAHFVAAEELLRGTVETQRRILGDEHSDTLVSRLALSRALWNQSEFDEADALGLEVVEAARRTLGESHELTLRAKFQLAEQYQGAGRYAEADGQLRRLLELRRGTLGDDHPDTLTTISKLGEVAMERGRFDEAEARFLEAQDEVRRVYGPEHPAYLLVRQWLGVLYDKQARGEEALEVHREILAVQRRVLGSGHLDTLLSINAAGAALDNSGRHEEAEEYYLEAFEGFVNLLGEEAEPTLMVRGNLAVLYLNTDRLDEAEEWGRQTYEGLVSLRGADHPDTILRLENLANVYFQQGNEGHALEILEQVLDARRRILGNEHPAVTRTLVNFSVVLAGLGETARATAVQEELLERSVAGLGFDYASVADELQKLAVKRYKAGENEEALQSIDQALRIRMAVLEPDHPDTLSTMVNRMGLARLSGRWAEVEPLVREYYEAHVRAYGEGHASTIQCVERIVAGYEEEGDEEQAAAWRARMSVGE